MPPDQIVVALQNVVSKLESMDDRIAAIDTSIRGDDSRGVQGMKQHITKLQKEFHEHTESDHTSFEAINQTVTSVKGWIAGAVFVVGVIVAVFKMAF